MFLLFSLFSPDACQYVADNCRANVIVVEDQKQLEKILTVRNELPRLKAVVQYTGIPQFKDQNGHDIDDFIYSWKEFLNIGKYGDFLQDRKKDTLQKELDDRLERIAVNQCCTLFYTSGTTGRPKGAMISHDNLTWTARVNNEFYSITSADINLSYLPLSHAAAQMADLCMMVGEYTLLTDCQ